VLEEGGVGDVSFDELDTRGSNFNPHRSSTWITTPSFPSTLLYTLRRGVLSKCAAGAPEDQKSRSKHRGDVSVLADVA
jgi:hypothetical protein